MSFRQYVKKDRKPEACNFECLQCVFSFKHGTECRRHPPPYPRTSSGDYCGDGLWYFWSERFKEYVPYYYGEWNWADEYQSGEEDDT